MFGSDDQTHAICANHFRPVIDYISRNIGTYIIMYIRFYLQLIDRHTPLVKHT